MRFLAMAFLFCLTSSIVNAQAFQSEKPVICDDTQKVIKTLTETFKEKPTWSGGDGQNGSVYGLFVDTKTGSWTLVQMTKDIACVLGVGEDSKLMGESI